MTKAIIIFADGSKQMAHNLDDSHLRWYERKVHQAEQIEQEFKVGLAILDASNPENIDVADAWRGQLMDAKMALEERRLLVNGNFRFSRTYTLIGLAIVVVNTQLSKLSNAIKKMRMKESDNNSLDELRRVVKEYKEENNTLRQGNVLLKDEIIRLQRLLIEQFGISESVVLRETA